MITNLLITHAHTHTNIDEAPQKDDTAIYTAPSVTTNEKSKFNEKRVNKGIHRQTFHMRVMKDEQAITLLVRERQS